MHTILESNVHEVRNAIKDILYMYLDIALQEGDLSEVELGDFDPFKFIDARIASEYMLLTDIEFRILREGAAIALLSEIANIYFEDGCQCNDVMPYFNSNHRLPHGFENVYPHLPLIKQAFDNGRIIKNRYIERCFQDAFTDEGRFYRSCRTLLNKIIITCFEECAL